MYTKIKRMPPESKTNRLAEVVKNGVCAEKDAYFEFAVYEAYGMPDSCGFDKPADSSFDWLGED